LKKLRAETITDLKNTKLRRDSEIVHEEYARSAEVENPLWLKFGEAA
jgi:hypothetical protein